MQESFAALGVQASATSNKAPATHGASTAAASRPRHRAPRPSAPISPLARARRHTCSCRVFPATSRCVLQRSALSAGARRLSRDSCAPPFPPWTRHCTQPLTPCARPPRCCALRVAVWRSACRARLLWRCACARVWLASSAAASRGSDTPLDVLPGTARRPADRARRSRRRGVQGVARADPAGAAPARCVRFRCVCQP